MFTVLNHFLLRGDVQETPKFKRRRPPIPALQSPVTITLVAFFPHCLFNMNCDLRECILGLRGLLL